MTTNVLILCTHNSARSVLGEAMLNHFAARAGCDVRAYSAGSAPSERVHPLALEVLTDAGVPTAGLRSKSWDEFSRPGAPPMRIVITVCDRAAEKPCPSWPGSPVRMHWGYPDPCIAAGDHVARRHAFELTRQAMGLRLLELLQLPLKSMDDAALRLELDRLLEIQ